MYIWTLIGLVSVAIVFYKFLHGLGKTLPFLELLLLLAGLQWIVGAYIEYQTPFEHYKYYMYVKEEEYMGFVVPAYCCFSIVLLYFSSKFGFNQINIEKLANYSDFAIKLLLFSLIVDFTSSFAPPQLKFVFFLIANMKYVAAIILYFSSVDWHKYVLYGAVALLLFRSLSSAMFHDFLLWSVFFYIFWSFQKKPSIILSLSILLSGFLISTVIQSVKSEYRSVIWAEQGFSGNKTTLFLDILTAKLSGGLSDDQEDNEALNVRLNQGWIISAVIDHTPKIEPFANGETIKEAVFATLLPRVLYEGKKQAGGVENFERFTGLSLSSGTSMGLSILGEAYANFGKNGGLIFMSVWGVTLGLIWRFLIVQANRNSIFLFFIPLFFLQAVKAETELVVVFNHLIKAILLVFLMIFFASNMLNIQLENQSNEH